MNGAVDCCRILIIVWLLWFARNQHELEEEVPPEAVEFTKRDQQSLLQLEGDR